MKKPCHSGLDPESIQIMTLSVDSHFLVCEGRRENDKEYYV
jgi:hypothetical protein